MQSLGTSQIKEENIPNSIFQIRPLSTIESRVQVPIKKLLNLPSVANHNGVLLYTNFSIMRHTRPEDPLITSPPCF